MNAPSARRSAAWVENAAPTSRWPPLRFRQFWDHRELIWFFAVRDVKVRYKQAFLGLGWAVLQPLIGALTFTVLFNGLADVDVGDRSYFAFALVGFSVWTYFSATLSAGTGSLLYNADLLTKVAFPRIVAPAATMLPSLIDLAIGAVLAVVVGIASGDSLSPLGIVIGIPIGLPLLLVTVAGPVLFFSATVVRYRDMGVVVGFGLQLLLFASPVAYPPELVPLPWRTLLYLNPVSGCLGLLRSALIGTDLPTAPQVLLSVIVAVAVLFAGLLHFRRTEREFADII